MRLSKKMVLTTLGLAAAPLALLLAALFSLLGGKAENRPLLLILISAGLLSLLLGSLLMLRWQRKHLSRPLKKLREASHFIAEGNLDFALKAEAEDEFSELFESFESMRQRLWDNAQERLKYEQDNKLLISNISHDLKTPLTAIRGYVEGLRDGVADTPEKKSRYLATIYSKAEDMEKLVDQLSFYCLVDSDRIPYHFSRLPARSYFDDVWADFLPELETEEFETRYENRIPPSVQMTADPEQLHRVLSNGISNAVKYRDRNKEKSTFSFRLFCGNDRITAELEDNGIGIPEEDQPRVFDRFFRSDASRSAATGGNGIGLAIVKKITEDHGGSVSISSQPGRGTLLSLIFPLYKET